MNDEMMDNETIGAGNIASNGKVRKITVDAVIIRADGSKENLGTIYEREYSIVGYIKELWRRAHKLLVNKITK